MIGLIVISHGRLAEELVAAAEHVVGPQQNIAAICIDPDDDMAQRRAEMAAAAARLDAGDGVILLTDMFGGTPSNLAISIMERGRVEVIAGVNLPMIIKLASLRAETGLDDAVVMAQEAGRKYINIASRALTAKKSA